MNINIIEAKASLEAENENYAERVRQLCRTHHVFLVNLMASPGAGKTSLLIRTIERLKDKYRIGVIEADVDADVDARTIAGLGVQVVQVHTGGSCHMDARMTLDGLHGLAAADTFAGGEAADGVLADSGVVDGKAADGGSVAGSPEDKPDPSDCDLSGLDLIFLENIGNLVCPAEFDVGADLKVMILSVPEGDDKPLKYPLMFQVSDCLLINKTDTAEIFDFDLQRCESNVRPLNAHMPLLPLSAKTGEGIDEWIKWLEDRMRLVHSEP